jgi:hypothetical protein
MPERADGASANLRVGEGSSKPTPEGIVQEEKAQLDMSRTMSYGDYLQLDTLLNAQKILSPAHDELLFIIQHQTSELWMKLMLHELAGARRCIAEDSLGNAFKMLARVSRIFEQLVQAWDVLSTMTPPEYTAIRPYLGQSSGFQSYQYRCVEYALGNKNAIMLKPHAHRPDLLVPWCSRPMRRRRCTTRRCACWPDVACRCLPTTSSATGRGPMSTATPSSRPGSRSIARRRLTSTSTSWARS